MKETTPNDKNLGNFNHLKLIVSRINTTFLFLIPFLLGSIIGLMSIWLSNHFSGGQMSNFQMDLTFNIVLFFWGISGLVAVIRREFPVFIFNIHGMTAIVLGLIWTAFLWFLVVISLFNIRLR